MVNENLYHMNSIKMVPICKLLSHLPMEATLLLCFKFDIFLERAGCLFYKYVETFINDTMEENISLSMKVVGNTLYASLSFPTIPFYMLTLI